MSPETQPVYPFVLVGPGESYLKPTVSKVAAYEYIRNMAEGLGATLDGETQSYSPLLVNRTLESARHLLDPIKVQEEFIAGLEANRHLEQDAKELSLTAAHQALERLQAQQQV